MHISLSAAESPSAVECQKMSHSLGELSCSLSMPDVNDCSVHEVIKAIISSWCPSFLSYSVFGQEQLQKSRSSFSAVITVLKSQFIRLKNRIRSLEAENESLKHANGVLQSDVAALDHELSNLKAEYYHLANERIQMADCAEQGQQKLRALTSDIDNAQNFIMAMIDINLHESFLRDAAESTLKDGQHAEEALIKAIARAANNKGSIWSRVLDGVRNSDKHVTTVDLALRTGESLCVVDRDFQLRRSRAKPDTDLDDPTVHSSASPMRCPTQRPFSVVENANTSRSRSSNSSDAVSCSSSCDEMIPEVAGVTSLLKSSSSPKPTSPCSSLFTSTRRPPLKNVSNRLSACSSATPTTFPRNSSTKEESFVARPEEVSAIATGTRGKTSMNPEPMANFSARNSDRRKCIIITKDARLTSALNVQPFEDPHHKVGVTKACVQVDPGDDGRMESSSAPAIVRTSGICLTALESLERICEALSGSDLGSLEVSSDDGQSGTCINDDDVYPDEEEIKETRTFIGLEAETKRNAEKSRVMETSMSERNTDKGDSPHADAEMGRLSEAQPSDIDPAFFQIARSPTPVPKPLIKAPAWLSTLNKSEDLPSVTSDLSSGNSGLPGQAVDIVSLSSSKSSRIPVVSSLAQCAGRAVYTSTASILDLEHSHSPDVCGFLCSVHLNRSPSFVSPSTSSASVLTNSSNMAKSLVPPKRLSGESLPRTSAIRSLVRQNGSTNSTVAGHVNGINVQIGKSMPVSVQGKTPFGVHKRGNISSTPFSTAEQSPKTLQGAIGRKLFRRSSNIPGPELKSAILTSPPTPTSSRPIRTPFRITASSPSTPTARAVRNCLPLPALCCSPNFPAHVAKSGQDLIVNSKGNVSKVVQTKPRSNIVNSYSPAKRSPLSRTVITAALSSNSDLRGSGSNQVLSTFPNGEAGVVASQAGTRTYQKISTKTVRFIGKTPPKKPQTETTPPNGDDASPPTAAFMKPSESPATKASKRMTNSIKPLIPTWTAGKTSPAQCRSLFRNSLSMVVR